MDAQEDQDVDLVTRVYEQCWRKSKGVDNEWISGKLNDCELTLYLALNAHERTMMSGLSSIVDQDDRFRDPKSGFTLDATIAAFDKLGLIPQALAVRELSKIFLNGKVPEDRQLLDEYLTRAEERDPTRFERMNSLYGFSGTDKPIYRRLAQFVRDNMRQFGQVFRES